MWWIGLIIYPKPYHTALETDSQINPDLPASSKSKNQATEKNSLETWLFVICYNHDFTFLITWCSLLLPSWFFFIYICMYSPTPLPQTTFISSYIVVISIADITWLLYRHFVNGERLSFFLCLNWNKLETSSIVWQKVQLHWVTSCCWYGWVM